MTELSNMSYSIKPAYDSQRASLPCQQPPTDTRRPFQPAQPRHTGLNEQSPFEWYGDSAADSLDDLRDSHEVLSEYNLKDTSTESIALITLSPERAAAAAALLSRSLIPAYDKLTQSVAGHILVLESNALGLNIVHHGHQGVVAFVRLVIFLVLVIIGFSFSSFYAFIIRKFPQKSRVRQTFSCGIECILVFSFP